MRKRRKQKITKRQKLERIEKLHEKGIILRAIKSVKPTPEKQQERRTKAGAPNRKNKHLNDCERGEILALRREGYSAYAIGKILNRASNTIRNELKKGTTTIIVGDYEKVCYLPERGRAAYEENRKRCLQQLKAKQEPYQEFLSYVEKRVLEDGWSLDAARGRALEEGIFAKEEVVSTGSLYNYTARGILKIKNIDLPERTRRKLKHPPRNRKHKRLLGRNIEERPVDVAERIEFGHWEIDTVIGKKGTKEVLLTLTERSTRKEIIEKMENKTAEEVMKAIERVGRRLPYFWATCQSITTDNGSEFAKLWELEPVKKIKVYYAHPYSAYERPSNERNNREIRRYIPKGKDMGKYSQKQLRSIEKKINAMPRRLFHYATSEELYMREVRRLI